METGGYSGAPKFGQRKTDLADRPKMIFSLGAPAKRSPHRSAKGPKNDYQLTRTREKETGGYSSTSKVQRRILDLFENVPLTRGRTKRKRGATIGPQKVKPRI